MWGAAVGIMGKGRMGQSEQAVYAGIGLQVAFGKSRKNGNNYFLGAYI